MRMDVYIDACIISGIVKQDMKSSDISAFKKILDIAETGKITIHSSTMALHEINQIPEHWRKNHLAQYDTLLKVKGSTTSWLDLESSTSSKALEYQSLRETLLSKSSELESKNKIKTYSPSQYIQRYFNF